MALKSTVYKVELQISDMDRQHYHGYHLTLAQHPSENDERMMVRVLAFALNASETLEFTKGLSTQDEPDLWQKDLTGDIDRWIELGQPDEKRLRKAAGRARQVIVYTYSGNSAQLWWEQVAGKYGRFDNLTVVDIDPAAVAELGALVERSMRLQCSIQDGEVWLGDGERTVHIVPRPRMTARN